MRDFLRKLTCAACAAGCCTVAAHQLNLEKERLTMPCQYVWPCEPDRQLADEPPFQRRPSGGLRFGGGIIATAAVTSGTATLFTSGPIPRV